MSSSRPTAADSGSALDEMFGEYPAASIQDVSIPGADKAQLHLPTSDGSGDPVLIGVEAGKLAFGIGMGSSFADAAANGERLKQLAALVVARGPPWRNGSRGLHRDRPGLTPAVCGYERA